MNHEEKNKQGYHDIIIKGTSFLFRFLRRQKNRQIDFGSTGKVAEGNPKIDDLGPGLAYTAGVAW